MRKITNFNGESVVATYNRKPIAVFALTLALMLCGFTYAMVASQDHYKHASYLLIPVITSAFYISGLRVQTHPAMFLTRTRAIYRPAWGRLEQVPFKDFKRMWLTRANVTSVMDRATVIVDALTILTIDGKIYVWPLTFNRTEDIYARLTESTNLQIEDHKKNDSGHAMFGNDLHLPG